MKRPPRFWAQHEEIVTDRYGKDLLLRPWGWSDVSEDGARDNAAERARAFASAASRRSTRISVCTAIAPPPASASS